MIVITLNDGTGEIEAGVAKRWDDLIPPKIKGITFSDKPYVKAFMNLFKYKKEDEIYDIPFIGVLKLKNLKTTNFLTYHILSTIKSINKDLNKYQNKNNNTKILT